MDISRIKTLAGLKESVTNDKDLMSRIEQTLHSMPKDKQTIAIDVLDTLRLKGPQTASELVNHVRELHPEIPGVEVGKMVAAFPFVVTKRDGKFQWRDDGLAEIPDEMFKAISMSTDAVSIAMEILKDKSELTKVEWIDELMTRMPNLPPYGPFGATEFIGRIINNLPETVVKLPNGKYAYKSDEGDAWAFLNDLRK